MTTVTSPLIGREHAIETLHAELSRAIDGHGGLVLVTGEAGIGKTALVTEAAVAARRRGALVLSGSCWQSGGAPGYWPWVQVVRGLRRSCTAGEWAEVEDAAGGVPAALLGERPEEPGEIGDFVLYDGVTTALVTAAQRRPLMIVLDDLHWADPASVRLLEFAARHTWFERLLLVGTYRDVEVELPGHPLRPLMSSLAIRATTVTLTGLGRAEVGALMARTVGRRPDDALVAEVHRRTGGNPFFVEQAARLWQSGGPVEAIAPGVRDAVQQRLSLLPEAAVRLLTVAAVLGREFHRRLLAAVAAEPAAAVDRLLEQAVAARLAVTLGGGRFAFVHDLVRETLYGTLTETQAAQKHAAVVRALERFPDLAEHLLPAELAAHAHRGRGELDPAVVVDHLIAAARHAGARMAIDEKLQHRRRALDVAAALEPRRRALIALDLGRDLYHYGEIGQARAMLTDAAACARRAGDPVVTARVALTLHIYAGTGDGPSDPAEELLRETHRALAGDIAGPVPLDRLAREVTVLAAARARDERDDDALAFFLWTLHDLIWGPGTAAERERLAQELSELGRRLSDPDMTYYALSLRWVTLLEQGDPRYLDAHAEMLAMSEREGLPGLRIGSLIDRSVIAGMQGRFAEAEELIAEAARLSEAHGGDHFGSLRHLRWMLHHLRGRPEEVKEAAASCLPDDGTYTRLLKALTAVQREDLPTARRHLAELTAPGRQVQGMFMPLLLRLQAQVAAATGDADLCERTRAAITPHLGQWAVAVYGCDVGGPYHLWLAMVDAAQRRWEEAIAGFTAAVSAADRLGARPWSLQARVGLAETLLARAHATGDRDEEAEKLLEQAEREAAELGMRHLLRRIHRARRTRGHPAAKTATGEFRFDGRVWALAYAGRRVHMPDAKGLRDLHTLLSSPGADVPATRLANPEGGPAVAAARALGGDPVLDEEAKARYRRRLAHLDEEIERATAVGDDDRAAAYDRERAALLAELHAATALAGRPRRLGDEAERARKTVTARIRDTLRRLDRHHPELAAHLRRSVSTGTACAYRPDQQVTWRL
ncbi:AAA family ATPase [Thermomonospora sp. CIF 1]|uniref:ATP-binding protein n=1 Tax=Thermomonospora sp. CIF 1 TaxID=1916083 RepID=UPI000CAFAE7D|nr:AAA family ATPase [Thermomonospora sp. CIF 1]PKK15742.1 MAG: ATPase [Thermomonospora sp. CIF 1]